MSTALDTITKAMKLVGVIAQNETPTSSEASDGLVSLNNMLESMSLDRTNIYSINQNNFPLVNGTASYSIGTGGDFNMARPVALNNVFIRIANVDYNLKEIESYDYDSIPYKLNGEFPQFFYYEPSFPLGRIYIYGVPTTGSIYIDTWQVITQYTNLATDIIYPPGYNRMITFNLAKEIAPEYGMALTPEAVQIANESLANVKDRNLPDYVMKTEVGYISNNNAYVGYRGY